LDGIYWVIRDKLTKKHVTKNGVSTAPHLYLSEKKALRQVANLTNHEVVCVRLVEHRYDVVPVLLTEIKEGAPV
jgi:hypothetical protein